MTGETEDAAVRANCVSSSAKPSISEAGAAVLTQARNGKGDAYATGGQQVHQGRLGDDRIGDDDRLPHGVADGRVAPGHVLHHARLGSHLDVVAGFDDAHKGHLQSADEVGERVLEAERDGDAADAKGGHEGVCVHAKAGIEDDTRAGCPNDAACDVDDDARAGERVVIAIEEMLQCARCDAGDHVRRKGECDGPQKALDKRVGKELE